jgi:hypothetical protein
MADESPQSAGAPAPIRILSLDGGGAQGFYSFGVLREIQVRVGKRLREVCGLNGRSVRVTGRSTTRGHRSRSFAAFIDAGRRLVRPRLINHPASLQLLVNSKAL